MTPASPAPPAIPDYELIRRIGQGSYGDVWLARGVTGLYRAIKVVWRARFEDAGPFEREFKGLKEFAAISLGESIQLALLHIGRNDTAGFFYYVMELADDAERGRDIDPARYVPLTLAEVRRRRGRVPAKDCVAYGVELARVLAGLHAHGLVHRDIKPSNIILVSGVAKVADIGLVTTAAEAHTYIGTAGFVPPEGPGTPAGDVYALGKLLYELSTGLDREEFPRLPPELGKMPDRKLLLGLNAVVLRACEPDVKQRYADGAAMLDGLLALQRGGRRSRWRMLGAAAVLLGLAGGAAWWTSHGMQSTDGAAVTLATTTAPKSIAVLPFENLNEDKANAFLADGIHEEILTNLANIASLHVISRTSVMQYRGTTKPISQIARELGVVFVLEGSVRRVGQKVRVTGQLIRAAADQDIWAKAYDGDMSDILGMQVQVATAIAGQLKAVLTPDESKRLNAITLADPVAYELYLQAKDLRRKEDAGDPSVEAENLLTRATKLDPKFVLSWVELASIHMMRFFEDRTLTGDRDLARHALDQAVALAPDRAEVEAGLGEYYYYGFTDFENAALHYQRALALEPSNARVHNLLGLLARRQLRWAEAIAEMRRAYQLDPLNHPLFMLLRSTLAWSHDYPAAKALALAQMQLEPDNPRPGLDAAFFEANITLSREPLEAWFAAQSPAFRATPDFKDAEKWMAYNSGDAAKYVSLSTEDPAASDTTFDADTAAKLAMALRALGRDSSDLLARSRRLAEAAAKAAPVNSGRWSELALLCALQGERARALFCVQRAEELNHSEKDLLNGRGLEVLRAQILAWLGDKEAAVDLLNLLLRKGGGGPSEHPYLLKFSVDWWPLRGDSRFEAQLADRATKAPVTGNLPVPPAMPPKAAAPANSVAVLPFANISEDKDGNMFFVTGIHEDLLTNLAHIRALKVISSASVERYREGNKSLPEIGAELGVAWVLEGSVQRAGNRVHVTGRLLNAQTGEEVWAENYNRELTDIFAVQAELSTAIAKALQTTLSPQETAMISRRPTLNPAAYDFYLRGRESLNHDNLADSTGPVLEKRELLFQRAVELDPNFAEAWGELAVLHAFQVFLGRDQSPERTSKAKAAIGRAVELGPDVPDVIRLEGMYYYYSQRDYARATGLFGRVLRLQPNDPTIYFSLSLIQRRQGRWSESLDNLRKATRLDPGNVNFARQLASQLATTRHYDEAIAEQRRLLALVPEDLDARFELAQLNWLARGSSREGDAFFMQLQPGETNSRRANELRLKWANAQGNAAEVIRIDEVLSSGEPADWTDDYRALDAAWAMVYRGNLEGARVRLGGIPAKLRARVAEQPANARAWSLLGGMEAVLGHKDEALRCSGEAVALVPESLDGVVGAVLGFNQAEVLAQTGEKDRALLETAHLLRVETVTLNVHSLKRDFAFASLGDDPRFQALVNDPQYNAPLP